MSAPRNLPFDTTDKKTTLAQKLDQAYQLYLQGSEKKNDALAFLQRILDVDDETLIKKLMEKRSLKKEKNPDYLPFLHLPPQTQQFYLSKERRDALQRKEKSKQVASLWKKSIKSIIDERKHRLLFLSEHGKEKDTWHNPIYFSNPPPDNLRVFIHHGLFVDLAGEKISTATKHSHEKIDYMSFVITTTGDFFAFEHKHKSSSEIVHSSMTRGKPVFYAGEIKIKNGCLLEITTHSGHYHPGLGNVHQLLNYFRSRNIDFSQTKVRFIREQKGFQESKSVDPITMWMPNSTMDETYFTYDAKDILENKQPDKKPLPPTIPVKSIESQKISDFFDAFGPPLNEKKIEKMLKEDPHLINARDLNYSARTPLITAITLAAKSSSLKKNIDQTRQYLEFAKTLLAYHPDLTLATIPSKETALHRAMQTSDCWVEHLKLFDLLAATLIKKGANADVKNARNFSCRRWLDQDQKGYKDFNCSSQALKEQDEEEEKKKINHFFQMLHKQPHRIKAQKENRKKLEETLVSFHKETEKLFEHLKITEKQIQDKYQTLTGSSQNEKRTAILTKEIKELCSQKQTIITEKISAFCALEPPPSPAMAMVYSIEAMKKWNQLAEKNRKLHPITQTGQLQQEMHYLWERIKESGTMEELLKDPITPAAYTLQLYEQVKQQAEKDMENIAEKTQKIKPTS